MEVIFMGFIEYVLKENKSIRMILYIIIVNIVIEKPLCKE